MTSPQTTDLQAAESCRRIEPRIPTPGKTALLQFTTEVDVVNQSPSGICIRFRDNVELCLNKHIMLVVDGDEKTAIVRWIKAEDTESIVRSAGCEFA